MTDALGRLSAALADRYRIERELGAGGMATVYLAADLKHDRKVALKVLRPELAAVLGADRFVVEIKTTAALQHPHILPLFDSGTADGFLYYVMPYVEGETLRNKLDRETQLGIDDAVRITREVADALDYAHRHGVIHRDIKPENILLHDGRPMVADFGIALAVSAAAGGRMTETGLSLGTPHYMSPEQATAEKDLTNRSDVYSLASVLYEMLTGNPPHTGASAQQIIMKIVTDTARPVTDLRKSVPPNVAAAVAQALEKLPADRFDSANAFGSALANPAFTTATAAMVPAALPPRRARAVTVLAALALPALALATWGWLRPRPEPPVIRYAMFLADSDAVNTSPVVVGNRLALSPDGARLAYVGKEASSNPVLAIRDRDRLQATRLAGTEGARRVFFSPDGSRVGYFVGDNSLWVVGPTGEPPSRVNATDLTAADGASWGSDGFIYAVSRLGGTGGQVGLVRVRTQGGAVEPVTTIDSAQGERAHQWPQVLPNGRGVLFTIVRGSSLADLRIAVVDLRTGTHRVLGEGVAALYERSGHLLYVAADGRLIAVRFDQDRLETTGDGRTVLDGIAVGMLGVDLTLSASGRLMYLSGYAGSTVTPVWVDRAGGATPVDPDWTFSSNTLYSTIALSPDESRLVVSQGGVSQQGQHLWVKRLPRGPNMQLTFGGAMNSRASWAPDGRAVLFVSDRSGINQVWCQVADGTGSAERVNAIPANEGFLSPDGVWFVYRGIGGDRHVYARRVRGDSAVLTVARATSGEDLAPTLSPDGRWIAYVSSESGRHEIHVRPFPDVNRAREQVSTAGGVEPRWARDGRALFYRNVSNELVEVAVAPRGEALNPGTPRVLFSMGPYLPGNVYQATYDVARGGRFVMSRRVASEGSGEQLLVVENFRALLRSTMER